VHWIYEQPRNSTQTHHILPDILFANVAITYKNMLKEPNEDIQGYKDAEQLEWASIHKCLVKPKVPLSEINKKEIVKLKMLYDKKYKNDGIFDKYKARCVYNYINNLHMDNHHFDNLYANSLADDSIKLIMAISVANGEALHSFDVKTAFLQTFIPANKVYYVQRPSGIDGPDDENIMQMTNYIYGHPEANAAFKKLLDNTLLDIGCTQLISDDCVFKYTGSNGKRLLIGINVDDGLISCPDINILHEFIDKLQQKLPITVEYNVTNYVGYTINYNRTDKYINLSQHKYIDKILSSFPQTNNTLPSTPMLISDHLTPSQAALDAITLSDPTLYRQKVGSLTYLSHKTRKDIKFAVQSLARHMHAPTQYNMNQVDYCIDYIRNSRDKCLTITGGGPIQMIFTVDSSYGTHLDLKSHTGYTGQLHPTSGAIISNSVKQTITADSSTAAEYIGAHLACKEIQWVYSFLTEAEGAPPLPAILFIDNQSTIKMLQNKSNAGRTKHINLRYNILRELVATGIIIIKYLPTEYMTSDTLTKALGPTQYELLSDFLLGTNSNTYFNDIFPLYYTSQDI